MFTRGIGVVNARAERTHNIECTEFRRNGRIVHDQAQWCLNGDVYYDGSCVPEPDPELPWSSWAAVEVDHNGNVTAVLRGTTLPWMPQSSQSAEFCARAAAEQYADVGGVTLFGDCTNVVASADMHARKQRSHKRTQTCSKGWEAGTSVR